VVSVRFCEGNGKEGLGMVGVTGFVGKGPGAVVRWIFAVRYDTFHSGNPSILLFGVVICG
jgi:hypothetical protein